MSDQQFRAVLDWWMVSDPWPQGVDKEQVDSWLLQECHNRGYDTITDAYHRHLKGGVR